MKTSKRFLTTTPTSDREHYQHHSAVRRDPFHEYQVNIIVDNTDTQWAPVIFETSPMHKKSLWTIEPTFEYGGMWRSDFMGFAPGFHRAQGLPGVRCARCARRTLVCPR